MAIIDKVNDWLGKMPSTNARIAVTLICVFLTCIVYLVCMTLEKKIGDAAFASWLMFLTAMSSVDAAVFYAKRKTHREKPNDNVPPSTP